MQNPPSGYTRVCPHFYVDDVDALHERALAAGAVVTDLETAPVGHRRFTATDPEGRVWVFGQRGRGTGLGAVPGGAPAAPR